MGQTRVEDVRVIRAPPSLVWAAIVDVKRHEAWHPFTRSISGGHALGDERRCVVVAGKKEGSTVERCVHREEERSIEWRIEEDTTGFSKMVSDWRAGFDVAPDGRGGTRVTARSVFTPRSPMARIGGPLIRRQFHKAQQAILAGLAAHVSSGRTK